MLFAEWHAGEALLAWIQANPAECMGTVTGVAGALMLATRCRFAAWAWPIWIASNAAWTWYAFALPKPAYGLIVQQLVFGVINLIGAWTWLRLGRRPAPGDAPKAP